VSFVAPGPVYPPRTKHARTDTKLILTVVRATADWQVDRRETANVKPIREFIWFHWELPRLRDIRDRRGGRLVRGKYPAWVPWSPSARLADQRDGRVGLEHVHPANEIVRDLLDRPPANEAMLIRKLTRLLQYAVVTPADNEQLRIAGVHHRLPQGSQDAWDRYRAAGLPLDDFRPLEPLRER
jgi:hypothetical protein